MLSEKSSWIAQAGSQQLFLSCPVREILYEGTRGPGKSDALLIKYAKYTGLGFGNAWRGIIFRETYKQLDDLIVKSKRMFFRIFDGIKYNAGNFTWVWPSGEELLLRHFKDVDDYWSYHGHEYPFIGWDELCNWKSLDGYDAMQSCNRSSVSGIPRFYCATTNPYGKGHNAVKRRFIDPAPRGKIIYDEYSPDGRVAIHGTLSENKKLMTADPKYAARLQAISDPHRRKAWAYGDWDVTSGGMFDDIWDQRIHVVKPFVIPRSWRLDRGFDWGSAKPSATLWFAESNGEDVVLPDGTRRSFVKGSIFIASEFYTWTGEENVGNRMQSSAIAKEILAVEKSQGWSGRVRRGPADSAIYDADDGISIAHKMEAAGVHFIPSKKGPGSRKNGWEVVREWLAHAVPRPQEKPGLFVFDTCRQTIRTFPTTQRDEHNPEDVDTDTEDHIADVIRYRLTTPKHKMQVEDTPR